MRRFYKVVTESAGSEIAEAALVLPLMFTLLLGVFWVGRAYNIYAAMNHAARDGARIAGSSDCASCANAMPAADVVAANYVGPILKASGLDLNRVQSTITPNFCACGSGACGSAVACDAAGTTAVPSICVQRNVDLGVPGYTPQVCGTAVSFQYPFTLPLPFAPSNLQTVTINSQAQARTEN